MGELALLPAEEREQVVVAWNRTECAFPVVGGVHELFEAQAARAPGALAVGGGGVELTYGELNARANRLAHYLRSLGVGADVLVGLCVERGVDLVVGILGIVKAGGAYVPHDPGYPAERLAFMLEDAGAPVVLTQSAVQERLPPTRARIVSLDRDGPQMAVHSSANPGVGSGGGGLAYVIYTSGSTGQPKGVLQTHRNVLHYVLTYTNGFHISSEDRLSLVYSFCVNAGNHDIFTALLNGASLFPLDIREEGIAPLSPWLIQNRVTYLHAVPTVFRHFVGNLTGNESFPHLRLIRLGGEPVYRRDIELYRTHFSRDCVLVNRLGSTETGTIRWHFIDKQTPVVENNVPVGYPVPDNEILLFDAVTEGDGSRVGEIAVKSRYLSAGYWRRPDLTRVAFLPDPQGGKERIYRTGDLGRMLSDGCLIHLGRKDCQVKIKGHRIEVGEVETAILDLPTVREAAVIGSKDRSGDQRLVAYVVPKDKNAPSVTALRRALALRLPDYMIPSVFLPLDTLPKAANGKVHRAALPAPGRWRPALESPMVPPRTPVEAVLCSIWVEVLGLDEVGVHDPFLELGGHSLSAGRVIARITETFHVDLPLRTLFEAPTVAELAAAIAVRLDRSPAREGQERLLAELEQLSEAEAERLLAEEGPEGGMEAHG